MCAVSENLVKCGHVLNISLMRFFNDKEETTHSKSKRDLKSQNSRAILDTVARL
jgi:hypothetical protein